MPDPIDLSRHPAGRGRVGTWRPVHDLSTLEQGDRVRVSYAAGPFSGSVVTGTLNGVNSTAVQLVSGGDTLPMILPRPPHHDPARSREMVVERWAVPEPTTEQGAPQ